MMDWSGTAVTMNSDTQNRSTTVSAITGSPEVCSLLEPTKGLDDDKVCPKQFTGENDDDHKYIMGISYRNTKPILEELVVEDCSTKCVR